MKGKFAVAAFPFYLFLTLGFREIQNNFYTFVNHWRLFLKTNPDAVPHRPLPGSFLRCGPVCSDYDKPMMHI